MCVGSRSVLLLGGSGLAALLGQLFQLLDCEAAFGTIVSVGGDHTGGGDAGAQKSGENKSFHVIVLSVLFLRNFVLIWLFQFNSTRFSEWPSFSAPADE